MMLLRQGLDQAQERVAAKDGSHGNQDGSRKPAGADQAEGDLTKGMTCNRSGGGWDPSTPGNRPTSGVCR